MKTKLISFSDYKKIRKYNYNQMCCFLESIYKSGFDDGLEDDNKKSMDLGLVGIAIQSTEGVGTVLHKRIMDTITKLCFENDEIDKNEVKEE